MHSLLILSSCAAGSASKFLLFGAYQANSVSCQSPRAQSLLHVFCCLNTVMQDLKSLVGDR